MAIILDETTILSLVEMPKALPPNYRKVLTLKPASESANDHAELRVVVDPELEFGIWLRKARLDNTDFSVIVGYCIPHSNIFFHLRRYNGHHRHTNRLERNVVNGYHIHRATERYQLIDGADVEGYAEETDRYSDISGALELMLDECHFVKPNGSQLKLIM